jgi:hypothetical protein
VLTVAAMDGNTGELVEFQLDSVVSERLGALEIPKGFSTTHYVRVTAQDKLQVVGTLKKHRQRVELKDVRIDSSDELAILGAYSRWVTAVPGVGNYFAKITSGCPQGRLVWIEIKMAGDARVARTVVVKGCHSNLAYLLPGTYWATLFADGKPVGVTEFVTSAIRGERVDISLDFNKR